MFQPPVPAHIAPYPDLVRVHHAAVAGDWPAVRAAYDALTTGPLRAGAARVVGEVKGSEQMLGPVAHAPGDSADQLLARTMLASSIIETGWGIRTSYRAEHVSGEQFREFHAHLRRAEQLLIEIIARQPDNVAAWNLRMMTARGLQLGQSEARRRHDQGARHEPHHLAPQVQMLQQLCPKWSGTLEQMHTFARECAQASPPGSVNAVLIAHAHLEHWATLDGNEQKLYLASPAVQQDLTVAANHSVLNPAFRPVYGWVSAHGYFALCHSAAGNSAAAAIHFRAVGDFDPRAPWSNYYGDADTRFELHRGAALAKG